MSATGTGRMTIDDLYRTEGKAELIGGRIVQPMPSGHLPVRIAGRIFRRLDDYAENRRVGCAYTDGIGYTVPELPSGRESFSPDTSYYTGPLPQNLMRFIEGAPDFAVEVRSENDYGPAAEQEMAEKRADYFAAGTRVVWDVDPVAATITRHRSDDPANPMIFRRGETADAEPALPGWRVNVDDVFG
jgi:Uma2 family endonuclease